MALGRSASDTGHSQGYVAANIADGNAGTYWESPNGSFPQSVTVDLGADRALGRLVLKLPTGWGTRTQTLAVLGSGDGSSWTTLKPSATYVFTEGGNTVAVPLTSVTARYLRLAFTANTGWPAGQLSELEAYAP
ncbi:discoidin domain-containing protein [Streptomyces sp. cmx-4-9]|uniref:discoidin domain-containing protein n=1 Tax=Streptomyces sp. cmx-4-9 TaxID=2790941 RepID=UPI00397FF51D